MPRTKRRLLMGAVMMGLLGVRDSTFAATMGQAAKDHVRTSNSAMAALIQHASDWSPTLRGLIDTINASNGIVYIEPGSCGHGMRACFINVTKAGSNRMLWVLVDTRGVDCDVMGLIGHELQHTVEVLGDPHVIDFAAMYNFYSREADPGGSFPFETTEAKRVGEAVRAEVRQNSRCTKVR